ncbi:extracellular solute-binding protein [Paenibacillus roseipurpureus]|uniref:Extracellular solute-binding protein n=1 Tax=Paenibacillus roseopurpureus TaxID=2918901 RepID=A0AA96LRM1_9BACL|nr:extracellular solute-binding protein [Paenibacillus sp. MBLB1832]WNR46028.1 extracellular solute-binding protein [Paenibacillus sp. MBLB1832]
MKKSWLACLMLFTSLTAAIPGSATNNKAAVTPKSTSDPRPSVNMTANTASLGKYDPPIVLNSAASVVSFTQFIKGEDIQNNDWIREYENVLGIKVKYLFIAKGDGEPSPYKQKLNVSIASNELPDMFVADPQQITLLAKGNKLADLTEAYNQYASPQLKEIYNRDQGLALKSATINGKLQGIPVLQAGDLNFMQMVWVRMDWLKKLHLSEPQTMQDLIEIAKAFTRLDPDGNGKADTIGIALTKDFYGTRIGVEGFFQGYHAYPQLWVKDASGKLNYGSIMPEAKNALAKLQELYREGLIDQEYGLKDAKSIEEAIAQNKVGILYGVNHLVYFPIAKGTLSNLEMDWKPFPLLSADDKRAIPGTNFSINKYLLVRKEYMHPEALIKMLNLYYEKYESKDIDVHHKFILDFDPNVGLPTVSKNEWAATMGAIPTNFDIYVAAHLKEALENKDPSKLGVDEKDYYDGIQRYLAGDRTQYATYKQRGIVDSSYNVLREYFQKGYMPAEFYGSPTPAMLEKEAYLKKLEKEEFSKIIMGVAPIDQFNSFVEKWKKLGGDQITKEVNDWKALQK